MATTPNYGFAVYDAADIATKFITFRTATSGTDAASNFMVLDSALQNLQDKITTLQESPSLVQVLASGVNIYTATIDGFTYIEGQSIILGVNNTNTGASTLNISGLGARPLMKYTVTDGTLVQLMSNDLLKNNLYVFTNQGSNWVLVGHSSADLIQISGTIYNEDASSTSTVRTVQIPGITSYTQLTDTPITISANMFGSLAPTTININGLGAINIMFPDVSGAGLTTTPTSYYWVRTGGMYALIYDGTNFIIRNVQYRNATTDYNGVVELALGAEVQAGTDNTKAVTPLGLQSKTATEVTIGMAELATSVEVITGTDTTRIVTPAGLQSKTATEDRLGLVELATQAEGRAATDGTKVMTAKRMMDFVDIGENATGQWWKYPNGVMEIRLIRTFNDVFETAFGNLFSTPLLYTITHSFGFVDTPVLTQKGITGSDYFDVMVSLLSTTQINYRIFSPASRSSGSGVVSLTLTGKWK